MTSLEHQILTAEVVYSGIGTPREGGAVVVQGERIVMVGSLTEARQSYPDAPVKDVGFAISPPPVNAHMHLDLSSLPYFTWFLRATLYPARRQEYDASRGLARRLRRA